MADARVAIAMSGGVDSSAAAAILKESGHDLIGFSMQLWDQRRSGVMGDSAKAGRCCSIEDLYDAREVAARLGIPYYVVDFQKEFERSVVKDFIEKYQKGLTPSPCVLCNSHMKFDQLVRVAEEIQAPRVATGHYARVSYDGETGRYFLWQARDKKKDQSYFLFDLRQSQLSKAIFPLGDLGKEQVRQIARRYGLPVADKPESREICFIPDGDYAAFVERHYEEIVGYGKPKPFSAGRIIDTNGHWMGTHPGIHHYTIGQRRGLGIAHGRPLYVLELRPEDNTVVVGERSLLDERRCRVIRPNWISIPNLLEPARVLAKIRSRHNEAPATIAPADDGSVEVMFDSPQPAISPGQACVFYQSEKVVGGGWISRN
jgi:tRNA-uridine 2-sulfurtransferase